MQVERKCLLRAELTCEQASNKCSMLCDHDCDTGGALPFPDLMNQPEGWFRPSWKDQRMSGRDPGRDGHPDSAEARGLTPDPKRGGQDHSRQVPPAQSGSFSPGNGSD